MNNISLLIKAPHAIVNENKSVVSFRYVLWNQDILSKIPPDLAHAKQRCSGS